MRKPHIIKSLLILSLITMPSRVFAESTTVADILGDKEINNNIITELDEKEEEREGDLENQLLLQLPELTDNPSHILTFTDPSDEKDGVQLEIDSTKYVKIKSPYALPALGIGQHQLKFKFTDKEGATQTLEKELTVIPRPPILNAPQIVEDKITISGTGLANSEVIILLSSGAYNVTETLNIDSNGIWTHTFTLEDNDNTLYNISAYTRRYGFASNLSEVLTFNTDTSLTTTKKDKDIEEIVFSIESLADPVTAFTQNLDFSIYTGIVLILGMLIALAISSLLRNNKEASEVKAFKKKIDRKDTPKDAKENLTLRERLSKTENKDEEKKETGKESKEEEDKTTKKAEDSEKVVSKDQFMKDFKDFDPDDKKGKEKKVKVSLTSKEN